MDANVLLYTLDTANPRKQAAAVRWRDALWEQEVGRLSWQVLNELYANATRKLAVPANIARALVRSYAQWPVIEFGLALVERAWHWTDRADINYWDALILAAGERAGCRWLLSEDFQEGRKYGSVEVVNPFRTGPERVLGS